MVTAIRNAEKALGIAEYTLTEKQKVGKNFSRSLYISKDLKKGEIVTSEHIKSVRPGYSLHPKFLPDIIGKISTKDFTLGDRIKKEDFQ